MDHLSSRMMSHGIFQPLLPKDTTTRTIKKNNDNGNSNSNSWQWLSMFLLLYSLSLQLGVFDRTKTSINGYGYGGNNNDSTSPSRNSGNTRGQQQHHHHDHRGLEIDDERVPSSSSFASSDSTNALLFESLEASHEHHLARRIAPSEHQNMEGRSNRNSNRKSDSNHRQMGTAPSSSSSSSCSLRTSSSDTCSLPKFTSWSSSPTSSITGPVNRFFVSPSEFTNTINILSTTALS
mmetsp:Transcript_46929/g.52503  ORF Transcript_46929/g.52503 Transcript_46929/m.52503 type:complete len:235 (-) Transcript_46929:9834-10538(-)